MKKSILFIVFSILSITQINAQKENYNWYFGNNAGLSFSGGAPVSINSSALFSYDNSSTVSDLYGDLLFYTNGITVWNKNHQIMYNGQGLLGSNNAGQCALIVQLPKGTNNLYFIFTVDLFAGSNGFRYSIVDMSLQGGLGAVTTKNVLLFSPSTEKIDAIYNSGDNSFWILAHAWTSSNFYCYKLSGDGLNTTPVISNIGSINSGGSGSNYNAMGQLTFSEDGSQVVSAIYDEDKFELFDFDMSTGILSNVRAITGYPRAWGAAFSPDGSKLYVTKWTESNVYEFNLNAGSITDIINSSTIIGQATSTNPTYKAGFLQLGPDNKIYIARFEMNYIAVINNPNLFGSSCSFVNNGVFLENHTCNAGLSRVAVKKLSTSILRKPIETNDFTIFPNPNSGNFYLTLPQNLINKKINLQCFDIMGREVYKIENTTYSKAININIQNTKSGIYYITVNSDNFTSIIKKFIIE